ncbi:MAG: hypothetical protein MJZ37_01635 [Bacilli bacterium]|nr:hypothetical protein [Bacilli bacterium]
MKKNKLVGLAALALTLGMAGCGEKPEEPVEPCAKHTYGEDVVVKEATCTEKGSKKRTCTVCGYEDVRDISKKSHTYVEVTSGEGATIPATCIAEGTKKEKCSACGDPRTTTIAKLAHTYEKNEDGSDKVTWTTAPTCTDAGVGGKKHCTACNLDYDYEEGALGHTYAKDDDGKDIVDWTGEGYGHATCLAAGKGHKACTRCSEVADVDEAQLEHNFQLVGEPTERPEGSDKAVVRMYSCDRGCGDTSFGFEAKEVTAASKETLVINDEGGARFFGHPIGNDCELGANGDPAEDTPAVFDATKTGDFFEYKFDLTAEQTGTYKLYCTATAAQWMSNNRMDFWAIHDGDVDWTKALYIEDSANHAAGDPVEDYRYVLYVDGQVKDFDPEIVVPAGSNTVQQDYQLPYVFNFTQAGEHSIKLVMAGGYRSVFYKFTFRATDEEATGDHIHAYETEDTTKRVEPTCKKEGKKVMACSCGKTQDVVLEKVAHTFVAGTPVAAAEGKNAYGVDTCSVCGLTKMTVNAAQDLNGNITAQGAKLTKDASGNTKAKYVISTDKAYKGTLYINGGVDNAGNYAMGWQTGKNGGSSAVTLPDGRTNTNWFLNGDALTVTTDKYNALVNLNSTVSTSAFTNDETHTRVGLIKVADVDLVEGDNTIELACLDSFAPSYVDIVFIGKEVGGIQYFKSSTKCNTYKSGSNIAQAGDTYFAVVEDGEFIVAFWEWTYSGSEEINVVLPIESITLEEGKITVARGTTPTAQLDLTEGRNEWQHVGNANRALSFEVEEVSASELPEVFTHVESWFTSAE